MLRRAAACRNGARADAPAQGGDAMTSSDFDFLRRLLKARSGLVLSAEKQYLAESRLGPIARRIGASDVGDLVGRLRRKDAEPLANEVVEAMTTHESFFFRDKLPFEHMRDTVLPALLKARSRERRIRIWCAAAAGGQEPYSIAMLLAEMAGQTKGWNCEIVATDLCAEVLQKARSGVYTQFEVQRGLPI